MQSVEIRVAWQEWAPGESPHSDKTWEALKHIGTLEGAVPARKKCRRHLKVVEGKESEKPGEGEDK